MAWAQQALYLHQNIVFARRLVTLALQPGSHHAPVSGQNFLVAAKRRPAMALAGPRLSL